MASHGYIETQKGFFSSYWDTGLYGNYFKTSPNNVKDVIMHNTEAYACKIYSNLEYANQITDEEL